MSTKMIRCSDYSDDNPKCKRCKLAQWKEVPMTSWDIYEANPCPKLDLHDWINHILEFITKNPETIERTICAKCKYRNLSMEEWRCGECQFNWGNFEFDADANPKG